MKTAKFTTTILQSGNNTGIEVPENIIEQFAAGKKPPVKVTLNNYSYKSTVAVMGGKYLIPLSSEHRKNSNVAGGDVMEILLELDDQPRTVDLPDDFKVLLENNPNALAFYDKQPPSAKKNMVTQITSAKGEDTRIRRIQKIITSLENGEKI